MKKKIKIKRVYKEYIEDIFEDSDGCWVYLKKGFCFDTTLSGIAVEDDWNIIEEHMRTIQNEE